MVKIKGNLKKKKFSFRSAAERKFRGAWPERVAFVSLSLLLNLGILFFYFILNFQDQKLH